MIKVWFQGHEEKIVWNKFRQNPISINSKISMAKNFIWLLCPHTEQSLADRVCGKILTKSWSVAKRPARKPESSSVKNQNYIAPDSKRC